MNELLKYIIGFFLYYLIQISCFVLRYAIDVTAVKRKIYTKNDLGYPEAGINFFSNRSINFTEMSTFCLLPFQLPALIIEYGILLTKSMSKD